MKKIKLKDFEILRTIGVGGIGRVQLIRHKTTSQYSVVKVMHKSQVIRANQVRHVRDQHAILLKIAHPFVVAMEGFNHDERFIYFVLEYVPGGELLSYIRNNATRDSYQAALFTAQVTLIIEYLHSQDIVHRDIKPENLLLAEDGYLKLADFSLAKVAEMRTYTVCGTPEYMAPEMILNRGHGKAVDWWQLGVLAYELNTGFDPFGDDDPIAVCQNIISCKLEFPKSMDRNAKSLIKLLLVPDESKRLGMLSNNAEDVKEHKWFGLLDFKQLLARRVPMPYKPVVKFAGDHSNYEFYDEEKTVAEALEAEVDPFQGW